MGQAISLDLPSVPGAGTILLIDDDSALCELIGDVLSSAGFALESALDGGRGLARAVQGHFDLILLDVMLPVLDGFEVLRQLRRCSSVPVIMLTARNSQQDRVAGLNAGADDYLPKPFGTEELLARVRAVLRRTSHAASGQSETAVGKLRLNRVSGKVWAGSESISITATEFTILDLLASSAGQVVTRDEVCAALYQRPATPFERSLEVHVSHLRRKLDGTGVLIRPVRGVGYLLAEEGH